MGLLATQDGDEGVERDETREHRIAMEIIVDAYDAEEQAMGWCGYLDEKPSFPFLARCIARRVISPLQVRDEGEPQHLPAVDVPTTFRSRSDRVSEDVDGSESIHQGSLVVSLRRCLLRRLVGRVPADGRRW